MNWYVLHTHPKNEKKVAERLRQKGIEVYLPLQKVIRQWSDRKKKVQIPLIRGYVFIKTEETRREEALLTPGVVRYLFWLGKPAIVREEEIKAMQAFLGELDYLPEEAFSFESGQRVDIEAGAFKNQAGTLLARQGNRLLLRIESLGQLIKVEIPIQHIKNPQLVSH